MSYVRYMARTQLPGSVRQRVRRVFDALVTNPHPSERRTLIGKLGTS